MGGAFPTRTRSTLPSDIHEPEIWKEIAYNFAKGLTNIIDIVQPDVIILGGSVSTYFDRFKAPLATYLSSMSTPLTPVPPIIEAARPEKAVLYGCYDLVKMRHGPFH